MSVIQRTPRDKAIARVSDKNGRKLTKEQEAETSCTEYSKPTECHGGVEWYEFKRVKERMGMHK